MDRKYGVMFILRPDTTDEDVDRLLQQMETNVAATGGRVTGFERMGKRRLAYVVRKFQEGIYILAFVEAPDSAQGSSVVKELERRLRVQELVIKFQTVRTDEEEKRLAKVKKLRDSKVRGRGTQGQAAAAAAAAQAAESAAETAAGAPPA